MMDEFEGYDVDSFVETVNAQWNNANTSIEIHLDDWTLTMTPANAIGLARLILQTIESGRVLSDAETHHRWQSGFSPN